jgi:hypothetical protein
MNPYFQSPQKLVERRRGSINFLKLLLIVLFFAAVVGSIKYFDIPYLVGVSKSPKSVKMVPEITACLVEIRGDRGSGTGFFVELKGKNFIVTNQHVLSGNETIEFYASDGETIATGNIFGAEGYDVALIQVDSPPATLTVKDEIDKLKLEDKKVIIPGNALGDGVFSAIKGKVLAVGPQLIEVDAKFVSGHSGSPIITKDMLGNYSVLGVATFTKTTKLQGRDQLSRYDETRWYGYRLDNIQNWQKITWDRFSREAKRLNEVETRTEDIVRYFTTGRGPIANDPDIIALSRDMQKSGTIGQRSIESYEHTFKSYITRILLKDIEQSHFYHYDYHRERFEYQKKIREEMADFIRQEVFFQ